MYEPDLDATVTLREVVQYSAECGAELIKVWPLYTLERKKLTKTCAILVDLMQELFGIDSSVAKWLIHTEAVKIIDTEKQEWRAQILEMYKSEQNEEESDEEWEVISDEEQTQAED